MLWLAGRTRPDPQYVAAIMASRATRNPDAVIRIVDRILDYLCETKHYRLRFLEEDGGRELRVYTDSSFAPSSGRSHGRAAVFDGSSPLVWRSARQSLVTMSTAESELLESIEGSILGISTRGLLQELTKKIIPLYLHITAACTLLTTSTGSWRTSHMRLRSNWLKERVRSAEILVRHEPGETQQANLGTKPFTKEKLKQLVALWGLVDTRPTEEIRVRRVQLDPSWLQKLLLWCQVCGAAADKPDLEYEIAWDLYLVVIVLAIAVIGVWECMKGCVNGREARLRALRAQPTRTARANLTKSELKELQRLLALSPQVLSDDQKFRMMELRERLKGLCRRADHQCLRFHHKQVILPCPTSPLGHPHQQVAGTSNRDQ